MDIALWFSFSGLAGLVVAAAGLVAVIRAGRCGGHASTLNEQLSVRLTNSPGSSSRPSFKTLGIGMLVFGAMYAILSWLIVLLTIMAEGTNSAGW